MLHKRCILIIFIIWIFGMSILSFVTPKKTFSQMENRYLAEFPVLSLEHIVDGSFEEKFETYLNDHFAERDFFVRLSKIKSFALGLREFGDVYYGKDETLLRKLKSDEDYAVKLTEAVAEYAETAEVPVSFALIPGAVDIRREQVPKYAPNADEELQIQDQYDVLKDSNVTCADIYHVLSAHAEEPIYYHTDHHWASLGAYYGYAAILQSLGHVPADISEYNDNLISDDFYGTLYSEAPFPWIEPDEIHTYVPEAEITTTIYDGTGYQDGELYVESNLQEKNQYTYFLGGNQPIITVKNPAVQGERLLVIRDSYMDSMVPFLTADFEEVHLIDPRYYKQGINAYIEENEIDRVLICMSLSSYMESTGLLPILK